MENWYEENLATLDFSNPIALLCPDGYVKKLEDFNNLVASIVNQSADELALIHHPSRIGNSLKKSKKSEKIAVLSDFGFLASVTRLKSLAELFHNRCVVKKI